MGGPANVLERGPFLIKLPCFVVRRPQSQPLLCCVAWCPCTYTPGYSTRATVWGSTGRRDRVSHVHCPVAFLRHAALRRVSAAVLFGDLQKAYYSVLVELVTGPLLTPDERRAVLENTSMDALRRLTLEVDLSQGHCLFDQLPIPQDLKTAVREWLRLAWFTVEGPLTSLFTILVSNRVTRQRTCSLHLCVFASTHG